MKKEENKNNNMMDFENLGKMMDIPNNDNNINNEKKRK